MVAHRRLTGALCSLYTGQVSLRRDTALEGLATHAGVADTRRCPFHPLGLGGYRSFFGSRGREFEHCKVHRLASGKLLLAPSTRHLSQEAFGLSVASAGTWGEAFTRA